MQVAAYLRESRGWSVLISAVLLYRLCGDAYSAALSPRVASGRAVLIIDLFVDMLLSTDALVAQLNLGQRLSSEISASEIGERSHWQARLSSGRLTFYATLLLGVVLPADLYAATFYQRAAAATAKDLVDGLDRCFWALRLPLARVGVEHEADGREASQLGAQRGAPEVVGDT